MSIKHQPNYLPTLFLAGILLFIVCACGSTPPPAGKPDQVLVEVDSPRINSDLTQPQPTISITDPATIQKLYLTLYALPAMPAQQACTTELGPVYMLTFSQEHKPLTTTQIERFSCGTVSIKGETQQKQVNKDFWSMLDQAIRQVKKTPQMTQASIQSASQPGLPVHSVTAKNAQALYDALLALPQDSPETGCADGYQASYQLVFQTINQRIPVTIDNSLCNRAILTTTFDAHMYIVDDHFTQLLQHTIDSQQ